MRETWRSADYFKLAGIAAIIVLVILAMWQMDRHYARFNDAIDKVDAQAGQLAEVGRRAAAMTSELEDLKSRLTSGAVATAGPRANASKSFDDKRYTWKWPKDFDPNGQMVIRWKVEPRTLNVITHRDVYGTHIQNYCYDSLITRHPDTTEFVPELAKYWTVEQRSTYYFADAAGARTACEKLRAMGEALDPLGIREMRVDENRLILDLTAAGAGFEKKLLAALGKAKPLPVTYVSFSIGLDKKFEDGTSINVETLKEKAAAAVAADGKAVVGRKFWKSEYSPDVWVVTGDGHALYAAMRKLLKVDDGDEKKRLGSTENPIVFNGVHQPILTFYMRRGVRWTDGKPVTAHDALFGYYATVNPMVDAAQSANYHADVESLEALDDYTLRFTLKKPYFKALDICGRITILPKHVYSFGMDVTTKQWAEKFNKWRGTGKNGDAPIVGNGKYKLEKWAEDDRIVLVRNEDYWGRKPGLKKLIIRFVNDDTVSLTELKNGNIDYMGLSAELWTRQTVSKKFKQDFQKIKFLPPRSGYGYVAWNMRDPIFKDRRVRLAMTHAMNRQKFIETIFYNLAIVRTGPFFPYGKQSNPDVRPWPFDLKEAARLLAEAGWKPGSDGVLRKGDLKFKIRVDIPSGIPAYEKVFRAFKQDLATLGVTVDIKETEWKVFEQFLNTRKYQVISLGWSGSLEGDPYQIWHSSQAAGTGSNHVGFKHARSDKLIESARTELDETARNLYYREFHSILHHEQPYTFFRAGYSLLAANKRFSNMKVHRMGMVQTEWYVPKDGS